MSVSWYKGFFRNLAKQENGNFYFKDEDLSIGMGVRSPNVIFKVKFNYKNNLITVLNRTGTAYVGNVSCELHDSLQPIAFEINNISHLQNLFLRKKSRLKITSKNKNIIHFLKHNSNLQELSKIAEKDNFSPIITCEFDKSWRIDAAYHLAFDNWTEPIEPIITLYKNLIDEFEKLIAYLNPKQYREMQ